MQNQPGPSLSGAGDAAVAVGEASERAELGLVPAVSALAQAFQSAANAWPQVHPAEQQLVVIDAIARCTGFAGFAAVPGSFSLATAAALAALLAAAVAPPVVFVVRNLLSQRIGRRQKSLPRNVSCLAPRRINCFTGPGG